MGRRLVIGLVLVMVFVAGGVAYAFLARDDDSSDTAADATTTTTTRTTITTTVAPSSGSTPTSTPTTTTVPPAVAPDSCGAESAAIRATVNNGVSGATDRAQFDQCLLAPVDPSWAAVRLVAKPGADFTATTVVLHGGGGSWAIVATGGTNTACNGVPQQVLVDLGIVCTSGGGGGL